jgi:ABC-type uncharacterized transport system ATPase subunit
MAAGFELRSTSMVYDGFAALSDVSLVVADGDRLAIIGLRQVDHSSAARGD